jgi:hypothetical protein
LESACVDNEAAISKRLAAIESNRVIISDDDCDARVTALETVAADVNAWRPELKGIIDDLCTQVQKVSQNYDRGVFDASSHRPGFMAPSAPAAADSSAGVATSPNGHHIIMTTRVPEFGSSTPTTHGPANGTVLTHPPPPPLLHAPPPALPYPPTPNPLPHPVHLPFRHHQFPPIPRPIQPLYSTQPCHRVLSHFCLTHRPLAIPSSHSATRATIPPTPNSIHQSSNRLPKFDFPKFDGENPPFVVHTL